MHFRNSNFKHKMTRLEIPRNLVHEKSYEREKILRTPKCHRKFIKNVPPEKRNENM